VLDQAPQGLFVIQVLLGALADGRRPLAAQSVLAMAAGTADIETGSAGFDGIL